MSPDQNPAPAAFRHQFACVHVNEILGEILVKIDHSSDSGRPEVRVYVYSPQTLALVSTAQSWPSTEQGWARARDEYNRLALSMGSALDVAQAALDKAAAKR